LERRESTEEAEGSLTRIFTGGERVQRKSGTNGKGGGGGGVQGPTGRKDLIRKGGT